MSSLAKTSRPFRYATVKPLVKKQFPIKGLHDPSPTSGSVASSVKWLAVGQGAKGSVAILPTKFKKWARSDTPPTINAHGNELADLAFSPFNDDMLVTAGRDNVVKLWTVPEGGLTENLTQAKATFADFDGGANSVRFHPSADNLLAAGAKNKLSIIDLGKQSEAYTFKTDGGGKDIMSLGWNYDGSLLSALGKNGVVSVFDPRSSGDDILSKATKLSNITKPQHSFFIGKEGKGHLALLGLDKGQRPTFNLFDARDLSKPVLNQGLDLSNGYMLPLYDIDTEVLLLTIRGSQTLTAFDVSSPGSGKPPALFQFYQYGCDTGFKGGCLQAKRACNFVKCEIDRIYLLGADVIQPYSFRVPRKVRGFHAELFPDTADSKAALSADEWLGGKNKDPMLTSIEKLVGQAPVQSLETKEIKHSTSSDDTSKAAVSGSASGNKPEQKITEITYRATATRMSIDRNLARSTFQHVSGTEPNGKDVTWFDLQTSESLALCQNICINRKFIAVPWRAVGGSALAIMRTDKPGRVTGQTPCVRGHKTQIVTFDLSRLDDHLLVTASTDGVAKLWKIPAEGLTSDLTEPQAEFATEGKGVLVRFHPYVDNCLVTASHGFDGSFVQFWDIKEGKPVIELKGLWGSEQILDLAFDPSSKHIATTSKDKKLRIIDPRAKKVICEMSPQEGERDTRVLWLNAARVLTTGFASGGRRLASVWSISEPQKALKSEELTKNNSMPIPHYDEDTSLLWIANNGSSMVQTYIVTPSAPFIELLGEYKSMADTTGQAFVHKTSVDVKKVEVAKSLKLSKDKIIPISWTVPRKRLEFFQDDVFPPTRALKAVYSLSEWLNDTEKEAEYVSLCPAGMTDLSKAPKQELTERQVRYQKQLLAKDAPKPKGILGHTSTEEVREHFRGISKDLPSSNRWDAKPDKNSKDVEDSEWD